MSRLKVVGGTYRIDTDLIRVQLHLGFHSEVAVEHKIRRVAEDNLGIIFIISS